MDLYKRIEKIKVNSTIGFGASGEWVVLANNNLGPDSVVLVLKDRNGRLITKQFDRGTAVM